MKPFFNGLASYAAKASSLFIASTIIGFGLGAGLITSAWWMLR